MKTNKAKVKVKSVKGKNVEAVATDKSATVETVKATVLALDITQNHPMRVRAAAVGVDLFATHSEEQTSKGYLASLAALDKSAAYEQTRNGDVHLLVVNGVANYVRIAEDGALYGRNGKLAVKTFDAAQAVYGNIEQLKALYGKRVELLTLTEARKRYDAQKETVTRTVGNGRHKQRVVGRVIASGVKGSNVLDVVANTLENGELVCVNCENVANQHNAAHRFTAEKATASR